MVGFLPSICEVLGSVPSPGVEEGGGGNLKTSERLRDLKSSFTMIS